MAVCKKCKAPIVWINSQKTGKWFPCNADLVEYKEDPDGEDYVVNDNAELIRCTFEFECIPSGRARIPHWATCAYADEFRRG